MCRHALLSALVLACAFSPSQAFCLIPQPNNCSVGLRHTPAAAVPLWRLQGRGRLATHKHSSTADTSASTDTAEELADLDAASKTADPADTSATTALAGPVDFWRPVEGASKLTTRLGQLMVMQWVLVPMAVIMGKVANVNALGTFALTPGAFGAGVACAVPIAAVMYLLGRTQWKWSLDITERTKEFVVKLLGPDGGGYFGLIFALTIGTAAGVGEEIMFRGLVQGALQGPVGTPAAVLLSATIFGALHAVTPMYALCAGLIGVYFSAVWVHFGNLAVPAIAHGVYDIGAMALVSLQMFKEAQDGASAGAQPAEAAPPPFAEAATAQASEP